MRKTHIIAALAIAALSSAALLSQGVSQEAPRAFAPLYPERDARGAPIFAVFEGRTPCAAPCQRMKMQLVLYRSANGAGSYWLGRILVGDDSPRIVASGNWSERRGVGAYPNAPVYELDAKVPVELRNYWRVDDNVMLALDAKGAPKPGNAGEGFMLSRYSAPYGPRTY